MFQVVNSEEIFYCPDAGLYFPGEIAETDHSFCTFHRIDILSAVEAVAVARNDSHNLVVDVHRSHPGIAFRPTAVHTAVHIAEFVVAHSVVYAVRFESVHPADMCHVHSDIDLHDRHAYISAAVQVVYQMAVHNSLVVLNIAHFAASLYHCSMPW